MDKSGFYASFGALNTLFLHNFTLYFDAYFKKYLSFDNKSKSLLKDSYNTPNTYIYSVVSWY